jgi:hypothetical protein
VIKYFINYLWRLWLVNRMSLRPGLTLNLGLIIQRLSRINIYFFQFYVLRKMFSRTPRYAYTRLKTTVLDKVTRGSVDCWNAMLRAGRSRVRVPMRSLNFFNILNPSSCTMGLLSLWQKWVPQDLSKGKARPVRKAENLITIYEPIV